MQIRRLLRILLPALNSLLNRHFAFGFGGSAIGFGHHYAVSIRSNKLLGKCLPSRGIFEAIERPGWMDMDVYMEGGCGCGCGWSCCPRRRAIPTEAGTAMTSQTADKWSRALLKGMSDSNQASDEMK